jgi:ketosteroid isomerase-like protein
MPCIIPTMDEHDAVRTANLDFYRAFTTANFAAMEALWAQAAPVLCIHPGWAPLQGRAAVLQSWRNIFANSEPTHVMCHDDQAFLYGDMAIVICEEELAGGHLIATNVFIREDGHWRIVHHQSGPLVARPEARPARRPH